MKYTSREREAEKLTTRGGQRNIQGMGEQRNAQEGMEKCTE